MNEIIILPIIGAGVAIYCGIRYSKNKSRIALGVGILFTVLAIIGTIAILLDK